MYLQTALHCGMMSLAEGGGMPLSHVAAVSESTTAVSADGNLMLASFLLPLSPLALSIIFLLAKKI
jgi:hypothetical protein